MKRVLYLSFLVFYFASGYAVSQERVRLIVGLVQHTPSHDGRTQIESDGKQARDGFPNYRQAKPKTICVLHYGLVGQLGSVPTFSDRSFQIATVILRSLNHAGSVLSRAPPLKAELR